MNEHDSRFQINDIILNIPPENISIDRSAQVRQYKPLRTRGSAKVRSPTAIVNVSVQAKFVGTEDINEQLRPLIAQFRLTPFCYIDNQYLSDSILGEDAAGQSLALALQNLTISTVENQPDTWNVVFSFIWFNYKPYSKNFHFKERFFDRSAINKTASPGLRGQIGSKGLTPFQLFYSNELNKLKRVTLNSSELKLGSLEFMIALAPPNNTTAGFQLDMAALENLRQDVREFVTTGKDLMQFLGNDALGDLDLQRFMGRLSGNILPPNVDEVQSTLNQFVDKLKTIKPNDAALSGLVDINNRIRKDAPLVFKGQSWLEFPIGDSGNQNLMRGESLDKGPVNGKLYYRTRILQTDTRDFSSGIVATSITINFNHKLAVIPLQGHQYPTAQSLGSDDFEFSVQFACLDDESNRKFTTFWNSNQNALQFARSIPQDLLSIDVFNELFQFVGVEKVLLTAKHESTVPHQVGMFVHELVLTENQFDISSTEQFVAVPTSFREVRKLIWKAIWNNTKSSDFFTYMGYKTSGEGVHINGFLSFTPSAIDEASRQFLDRLINRGLSTVGNLADALNNQANTLLTTLSKEETLKLVGINREYHAFQLMAGLSDDQTLGIEGLTQAIINIASSFSKIDGANNLKLLKFESIQSERDSLGQIINTSEENRATRLLAIRNAVATLDEIQTQIKTNDGIASISDGLIIKTNNGQTIDLGSQIRDPAILTEILSSIHQNSIGSADKWDDKFDRANRISPAQGRLLGFRVAFERLEKDLNTLQTTKHQSFFDLFSDWSEWSNSIADEIIENFIVLPIFKEAFDKLKELDSKVKGNLYRDMDFGKIKSDIIEFAGATGIEPSELDFEPDFYFWNDSIDSFEFNSLELNEIEKIKANVTQYYNNTAKDSTNWYQRKYLNKVNPEFKNFLSQSNKSNNVQSIDTNIAVFPGLTQMMVDQVPHFENAYTKDFSDPESMQTSTQAPKIRGKIVPLGPRNINDFNQSCSISSQSTNVDQYFDQPMEMSMAESPATQAAYGGWINPLPGARITSVIGFRKHPATGKLDVFHTGTDLNYDHPKGVDLTTGMPVFASRAGEILFAGDAGNAGNMITIRSEVDDPDFKNVIHRYMHLAGIGFKSNNTHLVKGDFVQAGDLIGVAGSTGRSTGPHLHFDVRVEHDANTWIYPFDHKHDRLPEVDSSGNSQGYTIIKRPTFIPISGTVNPALPNTGMTGFAAGLSAFEFSARHLQLDQQKVSGYRMNRAYPSIYLAFIEEDLEDEHIYKFDDYFSFASIVSLYCVRDREVAADYTMMELTNLSGILSNRKWQGTIHEGSAIYNGTEAKDADREDHASINTEEEHRFESLVLREGIKVEIRLGYSNDPDNNEIVFIGRITGVQFTEADDIVQVEMQSLATELVQDIKGLDSAIKHDGVFMSDARTGPLLEELIASRECVSFGFWKRGNKDKQTNRELLTDRWTWNPTPSSDNIFAPLSNHLDPRKFFLGESLISKLAFASVSAAVIGAGTAFLFGGSVLLGAAAAAVGAPAAGIAGGGLLGSILDLRGPFSDLSYYMYESTIWDVFKEMEHRHPDCISSPVPYIERQGGRTRMTMFFGNPDWLYFARDPTGIESSKSAEIKQRVTALQGQVSGRFLSAENKVRALQDMADLVDISPLELTKLKRLVTDQDASGLEEQFKAIDQNLKQSLLNDAISQGSIKPFRRYHLVTSKQHIVANNIRAKSSNAFNTVTIKYAKGAGDVKKNGGDNNGPVISSVEELTMKLDPLIPDEYARESVYTYPNCQGPEMAKRYAISHLQKACWSIYQGDLVILGNPSIKPYDIVFIYDEYSDMYGPIQVRRVTHMFDYEHGFISVITPDLVTTVTEGTMLTELQAMGLMAERFLGFKDVVTPGATMTDGVQVNPWKAFIAQKALGIASFFGAKKLLFVTQFGNPVRIHPLIKEGHVMVAGFGPPAVRENEFIINDLNQWAIQTWKSVGQSVDDFQNMFKNRQGMLNTRGKLLGDDDRNALATGIITPPRN